MVVILFLVWPHNQLRALRVEARDARLKIADATLYPPGPHELPPKLSGREAVRYHVYKALISIGLHVQLPSRWRGTRWTTAPAPYQNLGMMVLECDWLGSTEAGSPNNITSIRLDFVDSQARRAWTPLNSVEDARLGIYGPASTRHFELTCRVRTNLEAGVYHLVNLDATNVMADIWVK